MCVLYITPKAKCSNRDLNPSYGLERAVSLTGLDDWSRSSSSSYQRYILFVCALKIRITRLWVFQQHINMLKTLKILC